MTVISYLVLVGAWVVFAYVMLRKCAHIRRDSFQKGWDAAVCAYDFEPQLRKK